MSKKRRKKGQQSKKVQQRKKRQNLIWPISAGLLLAAIVVFVLVRNANQINPALIAVHGRPRACRFSGEAEYETIRAIKQSVSIPVVANGDIDTPEKARQVLELTGADALMIGRATRGRPWIFREIGHYLETGHPLPEPEPAWVVMFSA